MTTAPVPARSGTASLPRSAFRSGICLRSSFDDRGLLLERWQGLMLQALRARVQTSQYAALLPKVETWGVRAVSDSVGYRLVRTFRTELITAVYDAYTTALPALEPPLKNKRQPRRLPTSQADEPVWRLLSERPAHLVPPGYGGWEAVIEAALSKLLSAVRSEAGGALDAFTWGLANRAGIKHPLSEALPGLSLLLDPPDDPQPGDVYQPRVARPGFGASERFVVALAGC